MSEILKRNDNKIIYVFICFFIIFFSWVAYRQFAYFFYDGLDEAIFAQSMWTTLHGRLLWNSLEGINSMSHLGVHFSPILFLFLPFYALFPHALPLSILQIILLALGALPIYWISRKYINKITGLIFAGCYLLSPIIKFLIIETFHPRTLTIPLFLFTLHFLLEKKYVRYFLFLFLALMCKEDTALVDGIVCDFY